MDMYKWPSIDQFRTIIKNLNHVVTYVGLDENGNAIYDDTIKVQPIEFTGTVKLHGNNSSIVVDRDNYYSQSRERVLSLTSDTAGFFVFAENVKSFIEPLLRRELEYYPNSTAIVLYGEWCGKGIQKSVGVSELDKMFVLFGAKIVIDETTSEYIVDPEFFAKFVNEDLRIFSIYDFKTYSIKIDLDKPEMAQQELVKITTDVENECPVAKHFGIDNGLGEGVVWSTKFKNSNYRFKVKGEKHSVTKVKTLAAVDIEKIESVNKFIEYAVTENRLNQGLDVLVENGIKLHKKNIGEFVKWVVNNVIKEEADTIIENNIDVKMFSSRASKKISKFFLNAI